MTAIIKRYSIFCNSTSDTGANVEDAGQKGIGDILNYAWMLRQDGVAFSCTHHLYCMDDDDLSSEAECAAFILNSNSKDSKLAEFILDAWMALGIENSINYDADEEDIENAIIEFANSVPYHFQFELKLSKLLQIHKSAHNYDDVDSLYEFCDYVRSELATLQSQIKHSINQQFCRVRFGGQYDSLNPTSTLWFRVSSVGFNWADTIYIFASECKKSYHVAYITICRDHESDNGIDSDADEYFYKARDGAIYYNMPIEEFLAEEHEHSLVFSNKQINVMKGYVKTIRDCFKFGKTEQETVDILLSHDINYDPVMWDRLKNRDKARLCVAASQYFDEANNRTKNRLTKIMNMIINRYPEIKAVDIDYKYRDKMRGKTPGCEYLFYLTSNFDEIDRLEISTVFNRLETNSDIIFRRFKQEYESYKTYSNLNI